jgi:hypothetical protein
MPTAVSNENSGLDRPDGLMQGFGCKSGITVAKIPTYDSIQKALKI